MGCFGPPPADPRERRGAWGARVALARPDLRAPGERPPAAPEVGLSGRCLGGGGGDRVAVVGLSAAGKTSILQLLSPAVRRRQASVYSLDARLPQPPPTARPQRHAVRVLGRRYVALDVPGRAAAAEAGWDAQIAAADRVVFVVDASDRLRLPLARLLLQRAMAVCPAKPLLVLAHKQDLEHALAPPEVERLLEVAELGREGGAASQVAGSSCTKPGALSDAIGWLMRHDLVQLNQSRGEAPPPSPFKSHKGSIMVMAKSR